MYRTFCRSRRSYSFLHTYIHTYIHIYESVTFLHTYTYTYIFVNPLHAGYAKGQARGPTGAHLKATYEPNIKAVY